MKARVITLAAVASLWCTPGAQAQEFTPGHIYAPADGGLLFELDQTLQLTDTLHIQDAISAFTGAAFNNDGNLLVLTRLNDRVHFAEVRADGMIIRSFDTGNATLLRGSQIDYDPVAEEYIFANDHDVTLLDRDLQPIGTLDWTFERAAGVAFGPDGLLAATDTAAHRIIIFDRATLAPLRDGYPGSSPIGLDWVDSGLYSALFSDGELVRVDPLTLATVDVLTGLGNFGISDIEVLPSGDYLFTMPGSTIKIYDSAGMPLHQISVGGRAESVALFAPPVVDNPCPGDLDEDGTVTVADFLTVIMAFGPCPDDGDCPADITGDGRVGIRDFLIVLSTLGPCPEPPACPGDFDGDGVVNISDFLILLARFGPCPAAGECIWDLNDDGQIDGDDVLMLLHLLGACS